MDAGFEEVLQFSAEHAGVAAQGRVLPSEVHPGRAAGRLRGPTLEEHWGAALVRILFERRDLPTAKFLAYVFSIVSHKSIH